MFNTILIANRGEIACRIIRTAQSMGIKTVAVYSSADEGSLHVSMADSAYYIGEAPAQNSYLNIPNIIQAAQQSNAQAIHPGYGFLSENLEFATACEDAGIVFIGPSIAAIKAMASKQLAKQLLEKTSVPLTPGYHGPNQSEEQLFKEAKKIGFPVLIKAANGGGGKGMRVVNKESEFATSLAAAKRESMASFADDIMIIEKLIPNSRHIEIQIMADNFGTVVHLFERDCSIQRRHQKIIEEAPAPNLSDALRKRLGDAACEVAQSIQYRGAGTVEFLVGQDETFYFMEMNTRLQVEHPVTEMITGLDLVAWQFQIAANQTLPLSQEQITMQGHAIECRIYAEDPYNGFIPSIGQIHFLKEPKAPGIRIDTGITSGSHITKYYDPMVTKLIAWGLNRTEAIQRLDRALSHYFIGGIKTNIPFLQAIFRHPDFIKAQVSTDFLSNKSMTLHHADTELALLMAIGYDYLQTRQTITDPIFQSAISWQAHGCNTWTARYVIDDRLIETQITPIDAHHFNITIEGQTEHIHANLDNDRISIRNSTTSAHAFIEDTTNSLAIYSEYGQVMIKRFDWSSLHAQSSHPKGQLTAPMPATVVAILKKIGDEIKTGDRLIILEAMKMEHTIHAPNDGILSDIFFEVGAQVNEGAELLSLSDA